MRHDTQVDDVSQGLRRAQSTAFIGASTASLWIHDDLLLFGVIVVLVIVSFMFLPPRDALSNKPSVDRAMGAMVGGTGGGLLGALFAVLLNAMWQHTIPTHSMEIMTASMAGMIGGTLGGGWQFFLCKPGSATDRHVGGHTRVDSAGTTGSKSGHRFPSSRAN